MGLIATLLVYAATSGVYTYRHQTESRLRYQKEVRERWEAMPDKHPHRMAHYGYIVFREIHPLSIFDFGTESYTGNVVFLEAHRQNSVNFSEAGFSTGLLRFGELSMAVVLQFLLPLVLFFIGFSTIATDRENGTLKLLFSQGVSPRELIAGKTFGLLSVALCLLLPAFLILLLGLTFCGSGQIADNSLRLAILFAAYVLYAAILSTIAVLLSAFASKAKVALTGLIGTWLLFAILLPRSTQALGTGLYPSPSRIEFETAVELDILKQGDSHDPNDPHYKAMKDSVLRANNADSIQQLSFNYSGFQMREGERLSAEAYNRHAANLLTIYQRQNSVSRLAAFVNPFAAIRNLSMALSGTDFKTYVSFQQQAEAYRYKLAQHMNELQMRHISNQKPGPNDNPHIISSTYWKSFPDFSYKRPSTAAAIRGEALSLAAMFFWTALLLFLIAFLSKKLKPV